MYEIIEKIREGSSTPYRYYYLVKTKYGICKVSSTAWARSHNPTIVTAINQTEYFINQAKEIHGNEFCYKDVIYKDTKTKVIINCRIHGPFKQSPCNHLNSKSKCPTCSANKLPQRQLADLKDLIKKANEVHNYFYFYDKYIYTGTDRKSVITCPVHGDFLQAFSSHINARQGCPKCAEETKGWSKTYFKEKCEKHHDGLGIFYILKCFDENETFYKLGITSRSIKKRYCAKKSMPYNYEVIQEIIDVSDNIWSLELFLKKYIKEFQILYTPLKQFAGDYSECFHL